MTITHKEDKEITFSSFPVYTSIAIAIGFEVSGYLVATNNYEVFFFHCNGSGEMEREDVTHQFEVTL